MLSMAQVRGIVTSDEQKPLNLNEQYSEEFVDIVSLNWDNIKTKLIVPNDELLCNEFSFRLNKLQTSPGKDWYPAYISNHEVIVRYAARVVNHFFCERRRSVHVNFGLSMVVNDENNECTYIYSSRGNSGCLESSYLIHDRETFSHFFNTILPQFSIQRYMETAVEALSQKYEGKIFPTTIHFFLTRNTVRVYGKLYGITKKCCIETNNNMCIFNALSALFTVKGGKPVKVQKKRKQICKKRALLL